MTSFDSTTAPAGAAPPASGLPRVTMSGRLSPPWKANQHPLRPRPVTTSSAIHRLPAARAMTAMRSW